MEEVTCDNISRTPLERSLVDASALEHETQRWRPWLLAHGVHFEGAPEPFTIAPFVLTAGVYGSIAHYLEPLAKLIHKCVALYATSQDIQDFFDLAPRVHELVLQQSRQSPPGWHCRFDFVLTETGIPRIMEVDGASPGWLSSNTTIK